MTISWTLELIASSNTPDVMLLLPTADISPILHLDNPLRLAAGPALVPATWTLS